MEEQMELLFTRIKEEMAKQTATLTTTITEAVLKEMDCKLLPLVQENAQLKEELCNLTIKTKQLDGEKRDKNLIIFGLEENPDRESLLEIVEKTIKQIGIEFEKRDINKTFRIGSQKGKARPVILCLVNAWKRNEILRNKKNLPKNITIKEDFSKETLEKRKELVPQLLEERQNGRIAYLKHDKLIVKEFEPGPSNDQGKRGASTSPTSLQTADIVNHQKKNKTEAFNQMFRNRASSLTDKHKNKA